MQRGTAKAIIMAAASKAGVLSPVLKAAADVLGLGLAGAAGAGRFSVTTTGISSACAYPHTEQVRCFVPFSVVVAFFVSDHSP